MGQNNKPLDENDKSKSAPKPKSTEEPKKDPFSVERLVVGDSWGGIRKKSK